MGLYDTSSLVHKLVNRHCGMLHTAVLVEGGCGKKTFLAMTIMEERTKKVMEEMCVSV